MNQQAAISQETTQTFSSPFPIQLRSWFLPISGAAAFGALYLTSLHSYLLFHSIAEIFGIVISCGIFMLALNSRRFVRNDYFTFLGIAYLFVAVFNLLHTLGYNGMGVFPDSERYLAIQLWIAGCYIESLSLLVAPWFLRNRLPIRLVLAIYLLVTILLIESIFVWRVFPDCVIREISLTDFRVFSECMICLVLVGAAIVLTRNRKELHSEVYWLLIGAIGLTTLSELAYTLITRSRIPSLIGHFLEITSYYLLYRALIVTGLTRPYEVLFRNLKQSEEALKFTRFSVDHADLFIFWVSAGGDLIDVNNTACAKMGYPRGELLSQGLMELTGPDSAREYTDIWDQLQKNGTFTMKTVLRTKDERDIPVEMSMNRLRFGDREYNCVFAIDISEKILAERAREKLIEELQEALSNVKTLAGLLPICSQCKKIRDDQGYWQQLETYIQEHSGAEFSHGICPECAKKFYPEYFEGK